MTDRILLGFDGSDSAINALRFAVDLARAFGAELHVVAAVQAPEFADEIETRASIDSSVAQQVTAYAHCAVTVVRQQASFHAQPCGLT